MPTFVDVYGWEAVAKLLTDIYNDLSIPTSDNSNFIFNLIHFHAGADPLEFAIRTSLLCAFVCWFLSMANGTHSWVQYLSTSINHTRQAYVYQHTKTSSFYLWWETKKLVG